MRYLVSYQCNTDNRRLESQFEIEVATQPDSMNSELLDAARRDSTKFCHSGLFSLTITAIELIST